MIAFVFMFVLKSFSFLEIDRQNQPAVVGPAVVRLELLRANDVGVFQLNRPVFNTNAPVELTHPGLCIECVRRIPEEAALDCRVVEDALALNTRQEVAAPRAIDPTRCWSAQNDSAAHIVRHIEAELEVNAYIQGILEPTGLNPCPWNDEHAEITGFKHLDVQVCIQLILCNELITDLPLLPALGLLATQPCMDDLLALLGIGVWSNQAKAK